MDKSAGSNCSKGERRTCFVQPGQIGIELSDQYYGHPKKMVVQYVKKISSLWGILLEGIQILEVCNITIDDTNLHEMLNIVISSEEKWRKIVFRHSHFN